RRGRPEGRHDRAPFCFTPWWAHGARALVFPRPGGTKCFPPCRWRSSRGFDGRSQAPPIPWALERLKSFIRSIRPSLNRRFGGGLSTGFTRAISICGKVAVVGSVTRIVADSCACAASDHAAAIPPNRLMNARLFIQSPRRRGRAERYPQIFGWRDDPRAYLFSYTLDRTSPLPRSSQEARIPGQRQLVQSPPIPRHPEVLRRHRRANCCPHAIRSVEPY